MAISGAIGVVLPDADCQAFFADYLRERWEDEFNEAFDCEYHGRAEWAGLHARIGWHFLLMWEQYRG
jgi:hypothetical protein